jgi:hypothetical protein
MKSYQDYKSNTQNPTHQQNAAPNQGWQSTIKTTNPTKKQGKKTTPNKVGATTGSKNKGSLPSGRTF